MLSRNRQTICIKKIIKTQDLKTSQNKCWCVVDMFRLGYFIPDYLIFPSVSKWTQKPSAFMEKLKAWKKRVIFLHHWLSVLKPNLKLPTSAIQRENGHTVILCELKTSKTYFTAHSTKEKQPCSALGEAEYNFIFLEELKSKTWSWVT